METEEMRTGKKLFIKRAAVLLIALALGFGAVAVMAAAEVSAAASPKRQASLELIRKGSAGFDLRKEAGQKLYGYDTLQGACANGGIAYLTLYDRTVEKCRIVKVELKTRKVIRVSRPLPIYHANNLTYNTKRNLLLATCCRVRAKRAVFVDPETLTVVSSKNIRLSKKVKKLPRSERKKYKGFTAIAYNRQHDCYIGRLRGSGNAILFDGKLRPKKYIRLSGKKKFLLNQGMDSVGNYIYDVRSFKGKHRYSMVTVHTMSGKFVGQMRFPYGKAPGQELQCIFHDGRQFYAGFYMTTSQKNDTRANRVRRVNRLYLLKNMF